MYLANWLSDACRNIALTFELWPGQAASEFAPAKFPHAAQHQCTPGFEPCLDWGQSLPLTGVGGEDCKWGHIYLIDAESQSLSLSHTHTHKHACAHYTQPHTHIHTHLQTHKHACAHTHTRTDTHTKITHTNTHTHTTHTHIHTHMHSHTHTLSLSLSHTHTHPHAHTHTRVHTHIQNQKGIKILSSLTHQKPVLFQKWLNGMAPSCPFTTSFRSSANVTTLLANVATTVSISSANLLLCCAAFFCILTLTCTGMQRVFSHEMDSPSWNKLTDDNKFD